MGCFSCSPRQEKKGSINCFSSSSTKGKKRNMDCFSCFATQGSPEGKKRTRNCFSCFQTQEEKPPKVNGVVCFQAQDSTQRKKRTTQCFSCFQTQGKTRNMNCFSCIQAQYSKQEKKKKKRIKRLNVKLFHRKANKVSETEKPRKIKYFSCFPVQRKKGCKWMGKEKGKRRYIPFLPFKNKKRVFPEVAFQDVVFPKWARNEAKLRNENETRSHPHNNVEAKNFTLKELERATKNFNEEFILGEGGFGRVYKGKLEKTGEIVAVKQLNREGKQGNEEFLVEVMMLSHLCDPHLVKLVGYCSDGDQRLLVYEYMQAGSLENHLLDLIPGKPSLDWPTRIKVALHTAQGLEYLHETNKPPIIYRDLKPSNILLDKDFNAKLSDFGLARIGPVGNKSHVTSRVMGTIGYCAPEYQMTGRLTVKSDLYSYGVVLLELITGRRAVDLTKTSEELHLVRWAETRIKDPHRYSELVDPLLDGNYPLAGLSQVLAIAAMCLSTDASVRPAISDVVVALDSLVNDPIPSK